MSHAATTASEPATVQLPDLRLQELTQTASKVDADRLADQVWS